MFQLLDKIIQRYEVAKVRSVLKPFIFDGQKYRYFVHHYNATWRNERAVEVPIIYRELMKHSDQKILEVGNVLSHYFSVTHPVLDKYEQVAGVINKDIVEFVPSDSYDLIISISTLEHVGFDEEPQDAKKIQKAIVRMIEWLRPGGKLLVTVPVGYNPHLDELLRTDSLPFTHYRYLQRMTADNQWKEVTRKVLEKSPKYNTPFGNANVIVVAELKKAV